MTSAVQLPGCIKRIHLRSNDGSILCFSRIVLVVVLVLVIGLLARVFDYEDDDENDDDSRTAPSTRPGTLVTLANSSLTQSCGGARCEGLGWQGGAVRLHFGRPVRVSALGRGANDSWTYETDNW